MLTELANCCLTVVCDTCGVSGSTVHSRSAHSTGDSPVGPPSLVPVFSRTVSLLIISEYAALSSGDMLSMVPNSLYTGLSDGVSVLMLIL